jgi:hypothetical protein
VTVFTGPIRMAVGHTVLLRSSGLVRPAALAVVLALLAGRPRLVSGFIIPLIVLWVLPLPAYGEIWTRLQVSRHPIRAIRDCVQEVQAHRSDGGQGPGVYADGSDALLYAGVYYFRQVHPWQRDERPSDEMVARYLYNPAEQRPVLMAEKRYHAVVGEHQAQGRVERVAIGPTLDTLVLLPGPYAVCAAAAPNQTPRS